MPCAYRLRREQRGRRQRQSDRGKREYGRISQGSYFLYWSKKTDGERFLFTSRIITEDITVYAHWEEVGASAPTESLTYRYDRTLGGYVVTGAGQEADIRIPEIYAGTDGTRDVVGIADRAFRGKDIVSASLPATIKSIGMNAFTGCEKLTSVTIPVAVTEIIFLGTRSAWDEVEKAANWDYGKA